MTSPRRLRGMLAVVAALIALWPAGLSAQPPRDPAPDPLLAEIQAMRAELSELLGHAIRAQLLVARLQLQEQRTNGVVRQLQDLDGRLRENAKTREQVAAGMKMFGVTDPNAPPDGAPDFFVEMFRGGLEQAAKTEADLYQQQADLMRLLAEEQARWRALNTQLDELERMITAGRK
jgi:hypothetical protein